MPDIELKIKIEDREYTAIIPEDYTDITRLTWRNERPGVYATNPRGKQRWFRAVQIKQGRPL